MGLAAKRKMILKWRGIFSKEWGGYNTFHKQTAQLTALRSYIVGGALRAGDLEARVLLVPPEGKELKPRSEGWRGLGWEWELGSVAIAQPCFSLTFPEKKGLFI